MEVLLTLIGNKLKCQIDNDIKGCDNQFKNSIISFYPECNYDIRRCLITAFFANMLKEKNVKFWLEFETKFNERFKNTEYELILVKGKSDTVTKVAIVRKTS